VIVSGAIGYLLQVSPREAKIVTDNETVRRKEINARISGECMQKEQKKQGRKNYKRSDDR